MSDSIDAIAEHVTACHFDALSNATIRAAKVFLLDSFGVGLAGSSGPLASELVETQLMSGMGEDARVWGFGTQLPAAAAAMCNAYQIHNSEFDCIHEEAVVHVMAVVLPVAMSGVERKGGCSGRQLLEALIVGADVAAGLGVAAKSGLRFFRPATAGAFGGVAALGKLMALSHSQLVAAFSLVYGQLCGTMQAHTEGSMLLATQIGFNARNAVVACDLAAAGFTGPKSILDGEFGYFTLFEDGGDTASLTASLSRQRRIEEVAHKPFPSGRATHGIIDGCLELQRQHGIDPSEIASVRAQVPHLVHQLVGRPIRSQMTINYARLCAQYVAACALLRKTLRIDDFSEEAYADEARQDLARRVTIQTYDTDNPNDLLPVHIEIVTRSDRSYAMTLDAVYGSPDKPVSREAHLAKFRENCRLATRTLPTGRTESLIQMVDDLEELTDAAQLVDHLVP
ncbi:MAG: MmgE/PrpD family protein [Rhizobiales bacterium]|nr:MmgE/PrpD family protein [Hyphomicrobiales bacterium]